MIAECVNISIDITNERIVCRFEDGRKFTLNTDLFTISDFDLVRGVQVRLEEYLRKHFSSYDSMANRARQHASLLSLRNNKVNKKQYLNRAITPTNSGGTKYNNSH